MGREAAVGRSGGRVVGVLSGAVVLVAAVFLTALPAYRPTADIHSEYVKFLSGHDTITAYLAYPERRGPAPAGVRIPEIFGVAGLVRPTPGPLAQDSVRGGAP